MQFHRAFSVLLSYLTLVSFCALQTTTEKHRMSFPETVDEILDVSEDEGTTLKYHLEQWELRVFEI